MNQPETLTRRSLIESAVVVAALASARPTAAQPVVGPRPRVDFHRHIAPPDLGDSGSDIGAIAGVTASQTLADMDAGGVQAAMLSLPWIGRPERARSAARNINEHHASLVSEHRGRFHMFATLPLPDVDGSLEEVAYAFDRLGARGVIMISSNGGKSPGDADFAPVLAELNRRKAIVYVHPLPPRCCLGLVPGLPDSVIEFGADTARAVGSVLLTGPSTTYPDLRFIFSHAGGATPALQTRWANLKLPNIREIWPNGVQHELQRFFYDVAQAYDRGTLLALREMATPSQILFGTDFPYRTAITTETALRSSGVFSQAELEAIYVTNPTALLSEAGIRSA